MTDVLLIAVHQIHDAIEGNYSVTDEVDPSTGARKLKCEPRITNPGEWVSFPADEAAAIIAHGAAREPTPAELQLRQLQTGS